MTRTFHTVGEGAFYTEEFDNGFNVVYDCGGQNKKIMEDRIKQAFYQGEKIDILFISHFHNDHINGLEFLLDYCEVKEVILPLLDDDMKIQFIIENNLSRYNNKIVDQIILNPNDVFKNQELTFVEPFEYKLDIDTSSIKTIKSGELKNSGYSSAWIYKTYNMYNNTFAKKLKDKFDDERIKTENILDELANNRQNIIKIYKDIIPKKFNANSLVVYSGLCDKLSIEIINQVTYCNKTISSTKNGILYLGDFEVKEDSNMQTLKREFQEYWNDILIIQIPHHGSYKNYNTELSWQDSISIISTGFRYSHPSVNVIEDIERNNSICCVVSINDCSKVIQNIFFENTLENNYPECLV